MIIPMENYGITLLLCEQLTKRLKYAKFFYYR